ncbi:CatB-related O-acetyltransferase [Microvirga soli]|uniref:CatB-related O-acetyltransferase n=1 Tax=Microvirga soli TaxID=1854496 RepID=UPI00248387A4|nr:CatB-related O-acetyltransferase [Microvirga soli]
MKENFIQHTEDSVHQELVSEKELLECVWRLSHSTGHIATEALRFLPNGKIGGYLHENETFWRLDGGYLLLVHKDGQRVSTHFTEVRREAGILRLRGLFLLNKANLFMHLDQQTWENRPRLPNSTKQHFEKQRSIYGWNIGDHTYGRPTVFEEQQAKLTIGKYTSIAGGTTIALGNHRTDFVSTYPFATLRKYWSSIPVGVNDHSTRGDVTIGNDVWIGSGAFIGSGVTVGDGAVIGAHSVITKDVPPYAIAVGIPAAVIRYRFTPDIVEHLLSLRWWDWPDQQVDEFLPLILSDDIRAFLSAAQLR